MTMKLRQKQLLSVRVWWFVCLHFCGCMLLLNREEKHGHFSKFFFLFSTEDTGLKKTWEWVNNDKIFAFGELFTFLDFHHISYCCGGRVVSLITHSENHSFFMVTDVVRQFLQFLCCSQLENMISWPSELIGRNMSDVIKDRPVRTCCNIRVRCLSGSSLSQH